MRSRRGGWRGCYRTCFATPPGPPCPRPKLGLLNATGRDPRGELNRSAVCSLHSALVTAAARVAVTGAPFLRPFPVPSPPRHPPRQVLRSFTNSSAKLLHSALVTAAARVAITGAPFLRPFPVMSPPASRRAKCSGRSGPNRGKARGHPEFAEIRHLTLFWLRRLRRERRIPAPAQPKEHMEEQTAPYTETLTATELADLLWERYQAALRAAEYEYDQSHTPTIRALRERWSEVYKRSTQSKEVL